MFTHRDIVPSLFTARLFRFHLRDQVEHHLVAEHPAPGEVLAVDGHWNNYHRKRFQWPEQNPRNTQCLCGFGYVSLVLLPLLRLVRSMPLNRGVARTQCPGLIGCRIFNDQTAASAVQMAALRTRDYRLCDPLVSAVLAFVSGRRGVA